MYRPSPRRSGFSLTEIVVALCIVVVLAGVALPVVAKQMEKAKNTRGASDLRLIAAAFNQYRADAGVWPSNSKASTVSTQTEDLSEFTCMYANTWSKPGWDGPYLNDGISVGSHLQMTNAAGNAGLCDSWSRPYMVYWYASGYSGSSGAIVVLSKGPNGTADTSAAQAFSGEARGDDLLQVVTRRL